MDFIIEDIEARELEINEYLKLIEFLDVNDSVNGGTKGSLEVTPLLLKTMKGSVYLLLYSLVESTLREAIVAIHDDIKASNSDFDDLRDELKSKILFRARSEGISIQNLLNDTENNISLNLHKATLNSKKLFSGNVDRKKIMSIAATYGFSSTTNYLKTGHGEQLSTVKDHRNDLSHGNKTFSMVGAEKSIQDLRTFSQKVVAYVYEISENIIDSLNNKLYLKS